MLMHLSLTVLIVMSVVGAEYIQKYIEGIFLERKGPPYFHAVMNNNGNYSVLSRQMRELPGVANMILMDDEEMRQKTRNILDSANLKEIDGIELNLVGFKVIFEKNLKLKSMELIRQYLEKIAGKDYLTIGSIKDLENQDKGTLWVEHMSFLITLFLCLMWFFVNSVVSNEIKKSAYIVEQFQRRKTVALKTYMISVALFIITPFLVVFPFFNLPSFPLINVSLMIILGSLNYRKIVWHG